MEQVLDRTLVKELKTLSGDFSREAKFSLLKKLRAARDDLSSTAIRETFNECVRKHGRAIVSVCVAVTLEARKERIDFFCWQWANEILSLLSWLTPSNLESAYIDDGIHPTAVCEYAAGLIRLTANGDYAEETRR